MSIGRCFRTGCKAFAEPISIDTATTEAAQNRVIIFGEPWYGCPSAKNKMAPVLLFEQALIEQCIASCSGRVYVMHELLMLNGQSHLDKFMSAELSFDAFVAEATELGMNKYIATYQPLFEFAQCHADRVQLCTAVVPGSIARASWKESLEVALSSARENGWVADDEDCIGSEEYYNFFESQLTSRNMFDKERQPLDRYRNMFVAQVIKATSIAWTATRLLMAGDVNDRFIVFCGAGNMEYSLGITERFLARNPGIGVGRAVAVQWVKLGAGPDKDDVYCADCLRTNYGGDDKNVADFVFAYEELSEVAQQEAYPIGTGQKTVDGDAVKLDVAQRYNAVSTGAHLTPNLEFSKKLLEYLEYTPEQIEVAGMDACNYQGVNNPHKFAGIQAGNSVLDVGSGLGCDSFIAAAAVGPAGSVTGIDIAHGEVRHATERAEKRGLSNNVKFVCADAERIPFPEGSFDVVISNGAICLTPDKLQAFREFCRVLKPGGSVSIATETLKVALELGVSWPLCMQMFAHIDRVKPMLEEAGFTDVVVDSSNSLIKFDIEGADELLEKEKGSEDVEAKKAANKIHVKSEEFAHLKNYNMNELCARIVAHGRKPQ